MDRMLHLVGKSSNEIFMVRYPRSLLNFCEFDLAYFAENAIAVCDDALRDGELDFDRVNDLRNNLRGAHVYIENNIRSVYDKIVLDCWIDYVCRRDNVGTGSLWNRFMPCNTAFEKAVFVRLCEYRYNRGINEWLNLVRVQDYAKNKISFIFSGELSGADEAAARRNYFDLMFSVTARELGCRIEELGVTKVFSVGRLPSSPFMFPNISKDVVKNLLADFDYSEDYSDTENYGGLSDQIAMDAFSYMKSGLANEYNSYNMTRTEMENSPNKVYMPCGMKAMVDLEIDALIESRGWLARCKRCGRYFVRDEEHPEEYCSLYTPGSKTCLEIYELENPRSIISPALERACREITDEMYSRVDEDMTLSDYESWKIYLDALHDKVLNGQLPVEELEDFINYSRTLDISRSNPVLEVEKKEPQLIRSRERVVKPFIPQRIDRSELEAQVKPAKPAPEERDDEDDEYGQRGVYFTSPSVQRQKAMDAPMAHIIRGDRPEPYQQAPAVFTPFGGQPQQYQPAYQPAYQPMPQPAQPPVRQPEPQKAFAANRFEQFGVAEKPPVKQEPAPEPEPEIDIERVTEMLSRLRELEQPNEAPAAKQENTFDLFGDVKYESADNLETYGNVFDLERDIVPAEAEPAPTAPAAEPSAAEMPTEPEVAMQKPKVIRKNARAISAYGKISGAPVVQSSEFAAVSRPEAPADELLRDAAAIFDDLENSAPAVQNPVPDHVAEFVPEPVAEPVPEVVPEPVVPVEDIAEPVAEAAEPVFAPVPEVDVKPAPAPRRRAERPEPKKREIPEVVTEKNAPSGIWTEERNLFPEPDADELEMLKEKKRSRSNKTQRLFDAIMKEPEDNPNVNVRKKRNGGGGSFTV